MCLVSFSSPVGILERNFLHRKRYFSQARCRFSLFRLSLTGFLISKIVYKRRAGYWIHEFRRSSMASSRSECALKNECSVQARANSSHSIIEASFFGFPFNNSFTCDTRSKSVRKSCAVFCGCETDGTLYFAPASLSLCTLGGRHCPNLSLHCCPSLSWGHLLIHLKCHRACVSSYSASACGSSFLVSSYISLVVQVSHPSLQSGTHRRGRRRDVVFCLTFFAAIW